MAQKLFLKDQYTVVSLLWDLMKSKKIKGWITEKSFNRIFSLLSIIYINLSCNESSFPFFEDLAMENGMLKMEN